MAQNFTDDVFDPNHDGQTDLQNIENNFAALKSQFGGATAPANPVAGMPWVDLTRHMLCIRNEANSAWLDIFNLATGTPAGQSTNADTVDGIHASTTAAANKLLALNASGVMPCSITGASTSCSGNAAGLSATLSVAYGGTGSTTAAAAADNLSVVKRDNGHGNVGSFAVGFASNVVLDPGGTLAGSSIVVFKQVYTEPDFLIQSYGVLSGTWRCLGFISGVSSFALWQRIS